MASVNSLTIKEVFDLVRADLQKVEEEFCHQSISSVPPITEIGQYLRGSGGKRLRPALVLLSQVLPDAYNIGYQELRSLAVDSVNGQRISRLSDVIPNR